MADIGIVLLRSTDDFSFDVLTIGIIKKAQEDM